MIDVQEGRRLKAAAEEMQEGVKDASIKDALETVDAWDRWLDANIAALLDAAERTEAAERERDEAREEIVKLKDALDMATQGRYSAYMLELATQVAHKRHTAVEAAELAAERARPAPSNED